MSVLKYDVKNQENLFDSRVFDVLHILYLKKKENFTVFTAQEQECLRRMENARLLRTLIDPSVKMEFPIGYTPPKIEVEMAYYIVTGHHVGRGADVADILRTIMLSYRR